jgi:uncharacterized membrane protein affecting hemolysin expression
MVTPCFVACHDSANKVANKAVDILSYQYNAIPIQLLCMALLQVLVQNVPTCNKDSQKTQANAVFLLDV